MVFLLVSCKTKQKVPRVQHRPIIIKDVLMIVHVATFFWLSWLDFLGGFSEWRSAKMVGFMFCFIPTFSGARNPF